MMREMQEHFYLVLFIFASQLYFYIFGPSSYQYFNLEARLICNKAIRASYANQNQDLAILYKHLIVPILGMVDILMNEKNGLLVSLWSSADSVLPWVSNPGDFPKNDAR